MKFTASKSRAKFLDRTAKISLEPIDPKHPEWGKRHVVRSEDGRLLGHSTTAVVAWIHASRRLDREREEKENES